MRSSLENAHKLIRIYMGGLILGVNTLYMLSYFLKQFALVGKGLSLLVFDRISFHTKMCFLAMEVARF